MTFDAQKVYLDKPKKNLLFWFFYSDRMKIKPKNRETEGNFFGEMLFEQ